MAHYTVAVPFTSLVLRGATSTTVGDGPTGKGIMTPQVLNAQITENKAILVEDGRKSITLQYWTYNVAEMYVKMYHIDKLFPPIVWNYNHKVSTVKPNESTFKHFEHRALEV
jgi:hypothetical protein